METRKLINMAIFIALGIVLPIAFHFFGPQMGSILLPMHITVFLAGAFLGPAAGMIVGALTPLLSSLFTGMPPVIPMLPIMFVELAFYGLTIGYLFRVKNFNIYPALIISMLIGRIGAGIVVYLMVHVFNFGRLPVNPFVFVWGSIVTGLPGIILQLILVPLVLNYLLNYRESVPAHGNSY